MSLATSRRMYAKPSSAVLVKKQLLAAVTLLNVWVSLERFVLCMSNDSHHKNVYEPGYYNRRKEHLDGAQQND